MRCVPYFPPNSYAMGHALLGFGAGFLNPLGQRISIAAFVAYELLRNKPDTAKLGGILEFATGYGAQKLIAQGRTI